MGTIHYSDVDGGSPKEQDGTLVYVKPTYYSQRQEPLDIFNYATQNKAFPHETTADQFFSESQFESYRMLGVYTIEQLISEASKDTWNGTAFQNFFTSGRGDSEPPKTAGEKYSRATRREVETL